LNGSKSNYYDILSITANLFYYYLFRTEETINNKKIRKCFLNNPYREREGRRERGRERERTGEMETPLLVPLIASAFFGALF
jgi:hypothetical protein